MLRKTLAPAVAALCFIVLTGCGGGTTSTTAPLTFATLTLSTTTASFGSLPAGTSAASLLTPITLLNSGTAPLTINSITLGGTYTTVFGMTSTCGASLNPNATCSLTLTFAPPTVGSFSATITVTTNATGSPQTVTLTGTGTAPGAPSITFSPGSLTFPATAVGTSSASQAVAITNYGTAPLTLSNIAITGGAAASFSQTNNCPASLAANAGCSIFITFTPTTAGTLTSSISVTDNAPASPQSFTLTGTSAAPAATLSATSLNFTSAPNVVSAVQNLTLTNTGTATLTISASFLGGAFSNFNFLNICGLTLAPGASCMIPITFTPTALTTYTATITFADNATPSQQVVTLTGTGAAAPAVTHTLYVIPEADNSVTPLYAFINAATKTIDMTMYEMQDTTFLNDLVARCAAGVKVRVIFSQNIASSSATAYNKLNTTANCAAENSNSAYTNTHQKTITVDGANTAILSLNLQSQYYSTTRDYALITNDPADIAAIQTTFNMDWAAGTPYQGTQGASDFSFQPPLGTDLVWSPYSTTSMLAIINSATKTLYIENEEFSAPNIVSAVQAAAQRGVAVIFVGESTSYLTNFATIKAAGASVWYYTSSTGFYVHGKTVVADLGLPTEAVYMGSINYSTASLTQNRELGVYITGNTAVSNPIATTIAATIVSDESQPGVTKY
jgi:hypothetical protein